MFESKSPKIKKPKPTDALNVGNKSTQTPAILPSARVPTSPSPEITGQREFDHVIQSLRDALESAQSLIEEAKLAIEQPYSPSVEPPQKSESLDEGNYDFSDAEGEPRDIPQPWETPDGWAKRLEQHRLGAQGWRNSLDINWQNDLEKRIQKRNALVGCPPVSVGDQAFPSAMSAAIWVLGTIELWCPVWLVKPATPEDDAWWEGFPETPLGSLEDRSRKFLMTLANPHLGITPACLAKLVVGLDQEAAAVANDAEMRVDRTHELVGNSHAAPTTGSAAPRSEFPVVSRKSIDKPLIGREKTMAEIITKEPGLSGKEIASRLKISEDVFRRIFKKKLAPRGFTNARDGTGYQPPHSDL